MKLPRLAVTIPEVASAIAVSPRTIRRMLDDGELVEVRVRGARRVQYDSLKALCGVDTNEAPSSNPPDPAESELDALLAERLGRRKT